VSSFGQHPEVAAAEAEMRERAFDLNRLWTRQAESDQGEWLRSYTQADAAFQRAEAAYDSAVLWADLDGAIAYQPAPPEPDRGREPGQ
jgi:hypothetical protein